MHGMASKLQSSISWRLGAEAGHSGSMKSLWDQFYKGKLSKKKVLVAMHFAHTFKTCKLESKFDSALRLFMVGSCR